MSKLSPTHSPLVLSPSNVFTNEKLRGALTSVLSGGVSGGMNVIGVTVLGLSAPVSALLMLYLFGSIFGYSVDILFAKSNFTIKQGYNGEKSFSGTVPYSDMKTRALWLLRSFTEKHFFRFVITVIIDVLIGIAILRALMDYAEENDFLTDFKYRDMLLAGGVSIFTFFLYNNVLRFDWAYSDKESPLMDVVVLMWVALVLLIFAVTYSTSTNLRNPSNAFFSTVTTTKPASSPSASSSSGNEVKDDDTVSYDDRPSSAAAGAASAAG